MTWARQAQRADQALRRQAPGARQAEVGGRVLVGIEREFGGPRHRAAGQFRVDLPEVDGPFFRELQHLARPPVDDLDGDARMRALDGGPVGREQDPVPTVLPTVPGFHKFS